ncbi:MAG: hypothetical protein ACRD8W_05925 [Nitrososphaeraceae archaeon]
MIDTMEKRLKIVSAKGKDITVLTWILIVAYMTLTGILLPDVYSRFAITAGWFAAGLMCLWNFKSCRRYHCAITGPGFLGIGILSLVEALDIINLQEWIEWSVFLVVLAIGFGLEHAYKLRVGTCYYKSQQLK